MSGSNLEEVCLDTLPSTCKMMNIWEGARSLEQEKTVKRPWECFRKSRSRVFIWGFNFGSIRYAKASLVQVQRVIDFPLSLALDISRYKELWCKRSSTSYLTWKTSFSISKSSPYIIHRISSGKSRCEWHGMEIRETRHEAAEWTVGPGPLIKQTSISAMHPTDSP
jgi:hypothetical protein